MHRICIDTYIRTYIHTYVGMAEDQPARQQREGAWPYESVHEDDRRLRAYMHTYIHTYIHTYKYTCEWLKIKFCTHKHKYIHIYIHTYIHTYTGMAEDIHIYIHTYIHTYTGMAENQPARQQREGAWPYESVHEDDRCGK